AKCYLNEEICIVTSLNLYEFSQVNNNEMGILLRRSEDGEIYKDAYEEAQRIIRISEEVRVSLDRIDPECEGTGQEKNDEAPTGKLTTSKHAKKLGKSTEELLTLLIEKEYLIIDDEKQKLTKVGEAAGGSFIAKARFG